jgi:hypothetical protein
MKKNNSRKSVIQQLSKRFQTTIIGSLARFEDQFGYLWGLNSDKELTDRQKEFLDLWEYTRTSILNHGNNQMRDAIDEVVDYLEQETDIARHRLTFINPLNKQDHHREE